MTHTLVPVQVEPDVDEFLAHFGVKGMHWGVRNSRISSSGGPGRAQSAAPVVATRASVSQQRRLASGQARLDKYDGSTKRAILHLAGVQIAGAILNKTAHVAIRQIPSPAVRQGANIALDLGYTALTVRNVNEGLKVTDAAAANKRRKGR